jgi:hypothetical protein
MVIYPNAKLTGWLALERQQKSRSRFKLLFEFLSLLISLYRLLPLGDL